MIARGSIWLPLAILMVLAGLSFWIEQMVQLPANGSKTGNAEPESIIENFQAVRTDAEGNPQYRLSASRLKHYSGDRPTEMESPKFVHLGYRGSEVRASSQTATISADSKEVDLRGDVKISRTAKVGVPDMVFRTAHLKLYPEQDKLYAPGAVEIRDSAMVARAGAMEYDTQKRIIKLTGRVKAQYQHAKK